MFNQDFKAELASIISCGHRDSGPKGFPDLNSLRALVNSSGEKSSEIHLLGCVEILLNWDPSLITCLADLLFVVLYIYTNARQSSWR